ncbi:Hypothetical protein A7982_08280 [Minicystis rosea]|nr:Hypothetical protein A7982_08280 [Minicystis rosea]
MLTISSVAAASSHREAPAIAEDPAADNTDTYAFVQGGNLVVVANYIGLELPEGGPNWAKFSDDVLYEIHVARGASSLADALTYQFKFSTAKPARKDPAANPPLTLPNTGGLEFFGQLAKSGAFAQTYTVTQLTNGANPQVIAQNVMVPPPNVGPATNGTAYGIPAGTTYEQFFVDSGKAIGTLTGGGRVFAGPRDDPFFVDLGGVFDLAQLRPVANPGSTMVVRDSIAYTNVHAIVLEIPLKVANGGTDPVMGTSKAAQTVGVWASASRPKVRLTLRDKGDYHFGPWVQVSRLGLPLVNEAIIGLQDKDYFNRLTPKDDLATFGAYILNPIAVRDAAAINFYKTGGPLAGCATPGGAGPQTSRTDIVEAINIGVPGAPPPLDHVGAEAISAIGDVLRVDLGQPSGFPNGRKLTDDVVDVELQLLLCTLAAGGPIPDGPTANETAFKTGFPYLAPPWEGRTAVPRPQNTPQP